MKTNETQWKCYICGVRCNGNIDMKYNTVGYCYPMCNKCIASVDKVIKSKATRLRNNENYIKE